MSTKMTAPIGGGGNDKLETEILPSGFQLCRLYGIVDVGTHEGGKFGPKHLLGFQFEFPLEKRVFFEGQDPRPVAIYMENNYSMHENARLRAYIHGMVHTMSDTEAANFDIGSLLGKWFVANIEHSSCGKYANIKTLSKIDDKNIKMFGLEGDARPVTVNDNYFFYIPQGFNSDNFKSLPEWLRKKLMKSVEGVSHTSSGGTFASTDSNDGNSTPAPNTNVAKSSKRIQMISTDYSYAQYKENWTDEQLIAAGHAKYVEDSPVAPPKPQGPPTPSSAPSAPPVPSKKTLETHQSRLPDGTIFTLTDKSWTVESMITAGWTIETLIEAGHGIISGEHPDVNPHNEGVPF